MRGIFIADTLDTITFKLLILHLLAMRQVAR
jgi:hypothetical protein